jgi:hypothetical protein
MPALIHESLWSCYYQFPWKSTTVLCALYTVSFSDAEQRRPKLLGLNLDGKTPVIVDREEDNFALFECGAILIYLSG